MTNNVIQQKSYNFALKVVRMFQETAGNTGERSLLHQLLRSGTSIGANIEEAEGAVSKKDFIAKMGIAFKEARESHYWLRLLIDSNILGSKDVELLNDCVEILKILNSILRTSRKQEDIE